MFLIRRTGKGSWLNNRSFAKPVSKQRFACRRLYMPFFFLKLFCSLEITCIPFRLWSAICILVLWFHSCISYIIPALGVKGSRERSLWICILSGTSGKVDVTCIEMKPKYKQISIFK